MNSLYDLLKTGVPQLDNPLASGTKVGSGKADTPSGLAALLSDRNVQKFLAQLGTNIDPNGAGGNIGKAATQLVERQALGDALGKGGKMNNKLLQVLLPALLGDSNLQEIAFDELGNPVKLKAAAGLQTGKEAKPSELTQAESFMNDEFDLNSWADKYGF